MSLSASIQNYTSKKPLVYVTRDIERALGIEPQNGYFIITNDSAFGREIQKKHPENVWLVKDARGTLDTYDLLLLPEVQENLSRHPADILVFQNTARIERLCAEKGWRLLNPSAVLGQTIEEKISQVAWLKEDASLLPPHRITVLGDVRFEGKTFVLQFNHSHTGQGTYIIDSPVELDALKEKFPRRECRIVDFIQGPVFTVNVVAGTKIVVGNISYQITGLKPFTDLPFSTIGNDWSLPHDPAYEKMSKDVRSIALRIGKRLIDAGWRGLFGIDAIYDETSKKTYLLEINARQPASAVFESTLQKRTFPGDESIFEAHLSALLGIDTFDAEQKPLCSGSQIVARVTKAARSVDLAALRAKGLAVIEYKNDIHNKELFRIQSDEGIIKTHEKLNALGQFIASCIT